MRRNMSDAIVVLLLPAALAVGSAARDQSGQTHVGPTTNRTTPAIGPPLALRADGIELSVACGLSAFSSVPAESARDGYQLTGELWSVPTVFMRSSADDPADSGSMMRGSGFVLTHFTSSHPAASCAR